MPTPSGARLAAGETGVPQSAETAGTWWASPLARTSGTAPVRGPSQAKRGTGGRERAGLAPADAAPPADGTERVAVGDPEAQGVWGAPPRGSEARTTGRGANGPRARDTQAPRPWEHQDTYPGSAPRRLLAGQQATAAEHLLKVGAPVRPPVGQELEGRAAVRQSAVRLVRLQPVHGQHAAGFVRQRLAAANRCPGGNTSRVLAPGPGTSAPQSRDQMTRYEPPGTPPASTSPGPACDPARDPGPRRQ